MEIWIKKLNEFQIYSKTKSKAKELIHEVDKKRAINYKYYTEQQWGMAKNYTVSLNSSEIGYEKCIDIIMQLFGK